MLYRENHTDSASPSGADTGSTRGKAAGAEGGKTREAETQRERTGGGLPSEQWVKADPERRFTLRMADAATHWRTYTVTNETRPMPFPRGA